MVSLRKCFILLVMLTICSAVAFGQRRRATTSSPPAKLTGMKIIPYNGMTDTFAEEVTGPDQGFFNDLDVSFLVKVEVTGKAREFSDRNVQITVRQGKKVVLSRVSMVGIYNESGKYFVPFWIYSPLCQDTVIEARLLGQKQPSTIKKTITAHCGE